MQQGHCVPARRRIPRLQDCLKRSSALTTTLPTAPFNSPRRTATVPATDEQYEVLDMLDVQEELAVAIRYIEGLRPESLSP